MEPPFYQTEMFIFANNLGFPLEYESLLLNEYGILKPEDIINVAIADLNSDGNDEIIIAISSNIDSELMIYSFDEINKEGLPIFKNSLKEWGTDNIVITPENDILILNYRNIILNAFRYIDGQYVKINVDEL